MTVPLILDAALACDEVMELKSGKQCVMGIYGGDVVVRALPTTLFFWLWVRLIAHEAAQRQLTAVVRGPGASTDLDALVSAAMPTAIIPPGVHHFSFGNIIVPVDRPGRLTFEVQETGDLTHTYDCAEIMLRLQGKAN